MRSNASFERKALLVMNCEFKTGKHLSTNFTRDMIYESLRAFSLFAQHICSEIFQFVSHMRQMFVILFMNISYYFSLDAGSTSAVLLRTFFCEECLFDVRIEKLLR